MMESFKNIIWTDIRTVQFPQKLMPVAYSEYAQLYGLAKNSVQKLLYTRNIHHYFQCTVSMLISELT